MWLLCFYLQETLREEVGSVWHTSLFTSLVIYVLSSSLNKTVTEILSKYSKYLKSTRPVYYTCYWSVCGRGFYFIWWLECFNHTAKSCTLHHSKRLHILGYETPLLSLCMLPRLTRHCQVVKSCGEQKLSCRLSLSSLRCQLSHWDDVFAA